jgi:hypothetical protein
MSEFTHRPLVPSAFVGRERELRELLSLATMSGPPLVSLVGPKKIGRTSLMLKVKEIARDGERDPQFASLFVERKQLVTPYLDLGLIPEGQEMRNAIAQAIAGEMRDRELAAPAPAELNDHAALERLIISMKEVSQEVTFLPLIDRAERLLEEGVDQPESFYGNAISHFEKLTEALESFGLVLAFGVSGAMRRLGAYARERSREAMLLRISWFLSLSLKRIELGLMSEAEVERYASERVIQLPGGENAKLEREEVAWVRDLAGRHPFVLNIAGQHVRMRREGHSPEDTERAIVEAMGAFVPNTAQRLGVVKGARELAAELACDPSARRTSVELADVLTREGVAVRSGPVQGNEVEVRMPSRAIREAFLRCSELDAVLLTQLPGVGGGPSLPPPMSVSVVDPGGQMRSVRITPAECELLELLVSAPAEGIVTARELMAVLGPDVTKRQLTQRLSVLRNKLCDELDLPNPITNVYNQGYSWSAEAAVKVRR